MTIHLTRTSAPASADPPGFPDADELAVLRAWYAGLPVREAVERYQPAALGDGRSARGVLGRLRRRLQAIARTAHRDDLAALFDHPADDRARHAKAVAHAVELLRTARAPEPQITDDVTQWFAARSVRVLHAHNIGTLADLTVRVPRRRQWWKAVPGLGVASARAIEQFFADWPALTEKARALIISSRQGELVPWESLQVPHEVDGSQGTFRAPKATCALDADWRCFGGSMLAGANHLPPAATPSRLGHHLLSAGATPKGQSGRL
ncbi:hypothetical protein OKW32_000023 [Paraburkholderia youngii]